MPAPIAPTLAEIADELRWRLSNANSDLLEMDVAYDTHHVAGEPHAFGLSVSWSDPVQRAGGHFVVRVLLTSIT